MNTRVITLRKHWLVASAVVVLLAIALTAGALFAADERQQPDIQPSSGQLPRDPLANHETDPGLTSEYLALVAQDSAGQAEPSTSTDQVVPNTDSTEALAQWLDEQPEKMGFITLEDALTADADTMDWLLYQAVYKNVLTQEEADVVQAWSDRRPSSDEAPQLLHYQPTYLDTPDGRDSRAELLRETEVR